MKWFIAYVGAALGMLVLDALWLSIAAKRLYRPALGDLVIDGFRPAPAAFFYLLYVAGIVALAVHPGLAEGKWSAALWRGVVLGLVAYGTYDLTNQATLRHWPISVTALDMAWGAFLTGLASMAGYFAARSLAGT